MNIIDQLEQTVTPAVLGLSSNVAQVSLLEQFYAILVTRLALPEVYTQLQRNEPNPLEPSVISSTLFESLWQQPSQRHLLIQELAATHHIDGGATEQLLINATHLAYQELKNLANGQFLPAFLQLQQATVRQYLPVWATAVVSPIVAVVAEKVPLVADALIYDNSQVPHAAVTAQQALAADGMPVIVEPTDAIAIDAIHANPSEHYTPEGRGEVRRRNQRNDLLIRLLLLAAALGAIILLWAFVIKPDEVEPVVEPAVIAPADPTPEVEPPTQILAPAQLVVGVDYSGNLYSCSATVGDIGLQAALRQALNSSFGEQANICVLTVQEGVATTLSNMNIDTLPNVLTLMRAAPFSRLQLQNDSMSLEAPDEMLLQRLVVDVRTLLPTMTISSTIPMVNTQPPANTYDDTYNNGNYNNGINNAGNYNNGATPNNGRMPITTNNNMMTNQPNAPSATINNNTDSVPAPPPPQSSLNNSNNIPQNNQPAQSLGRMPSDVEDLANTTIMSEPAQGGSPLN
ncbi:hypothetical protein ES754_08580 [Psychrobacter frigidicola]|uniref:Uncharacterized protein n=1 Tax=Psychrobacter frigidicola TaxID=45611 RepID=A0A5C7A1D5_9GAMM|nr:hypothetical protein [Psychrobacter frigidicola]TXD97056.1 hypothetical protein ES754_08580 [Psychrobacter frigidicola]